MLRCVRFWSGVNDISVWVRGSRLTHHNKLKASNMASFWLHLDQRRKQRDSLLVLYSSMTRPYIVWLLDILMRKTKLMNPTLMKITHSIVCKRIRLVFLLLSLSRYHQVHVLIQKPLLIVKKINSSNAKARRRSGTTCIRRGESKTLRKMNCTLCVTENNGECCTSSS